MTAPTGKVNYAQTNIHKHENGHDALMAARQRGRNTTIVIGADQDNGILLLDIDVQGEACRDADELREQLRLIMDSLEGVNPLS